jgi:hypothetical protein
MMNELIGTWGFCLLPTKETENQIHPEDFEALSRLFAYGKVFHCVGQEGDYLIIQYDTQRYRVKPDLYQVIPPLRFTFGQQVRERERPEILGIVRRIGWHVLKGEPLIYLEVKGKMKSRRYFQEELEEADTEL